MTVTEKYDLLIEIIKKDLIEYDFKKSGTRFYTRKYGNWGLIEFQKNRNSTNEFIEFTISLGICSEKLMHFLGPVTSKKPSIEFCQWQERIGFLMVPARDFWWKINSTTDVDSLVEEVKDVLIGKGIFEIVNNISDEDLEKCWRKKDQGIRLTNIKRLIYLSSLLKIYNRPDLKEVAMELMVASISENDLYFEETAEKHIRKLGVHL